MDISGLVILGFLVFGFVLGIRQFAPSVHGGILWGLAEVVGIAAAFATANSDFGDAEKFAGHTLSTLDSLGVLIVGLIIGGIAAGINATIGPSGAVRDIGETKSS